MKSIRWLSLFLLATFIFSGCGVAPVADKEAPPKLLVATSFYPMYITTINIIRDVPGVKVINMTRPQTGCLHDYQLTVADMKLLETANALVVNGAGMENFLDKVINQQPKLKIVDASAGITLLKDAEGVANPHVWVSVTDNILQVKNIAAQLQQLDAAHAPLYQENAARYIKKLEDLRTRMHCALDAIPDKQMVTFHEAFPYFASEFNIKCDLVIEREPGTMPSPAELARTVEQVKQSGIKALFAEPQYSDQAAKLIARETGARVYMLDPVVTGVAGVDAYDNYIRAMNKNLIVLEEAFK